MERNHGKSNNAPIKTLYILSSTRRTVSSRFRRRYSTFTAFRQPLLGATQSNEDAKREHLKKQELRTIVGEKSAASGWGMEWIWGQLRQWQRHEPCPRKRVPERVTY